ncbi:Long palate, lung and nasal epithelium carcinoma-associated protein 4 [Tupaia chinensis]|uniref:Long palate, lung and nasal epithelium carcinoma-associated protein 4 n=1 Tax=Tupaia chinensis TaxID=246437 RepID=L9L493_TUPCH|nr:Long palate, lung and nasal epithelium carcinoma-associated protein 4 [Tupaia chinensis]
MSALNRDLLAQEGLLGVILLNNQNLVRDRETLLKCLVGSRSFPVGKDHLLEAAGSQALEGLLCKGPLGGLCGHGSLAGINNVLKSTPFGKIDNWLKIANLDITQVLWKGHPSSSLQLEFQTKLTLSFLGLPSFLSGSTVDVNIMVPFMLLHNKLGHISFTLKNCQPSFNRIHVPGGLLSTMLEVMLKRMVGSCLPNMLCPVIRFWFYIINQQLDILQNVHPLELFRNLHSPVSSESVTSEQYYCLDFQNKHFPASFINWLIERKFFLSYLSLLSPI